MPILGFIKQLKLLEASGILAAFTYIASYPASVEERQEKDWAVIRQVTMAKMNPALAAEWGSLGLVEPLQHLTRDCRWSLSWLNPLTWLKSDCVDLVSIRLEGTELGQVDLRKASIQHAFFQCSNLSRADLRGAKLGGTLFAGASLVNADLRGATFREGTDSWSHPNPFAMAALSGAKIDDSFDLRPELLRCGCVDDGNGIVLEGSRADLRDAIKDMKKCSALHDPCKLLNEKDTTKFWQGFRELGYPEMCEQFDRREAAPKMVKAKEEPPK